MKITVAALWGVTHGALFLNCLYRFGFLYSYYSLLLSPRSPTPKPPTSPSQTSF